MVVPSLTIGFGGQGGEFVTFAVRPITSTDDPVTRITDVLWIIKIEEVKI